MANGRAIVEPPVFTPLRFGLLSVSQDRTAEAPGHWSAGITWQSHCPDADSTYDLCLTEAGPGAEEPPDKADTTEFLLRGATPFAVYARFSCSPAGFYERAQQLAEQAIVRAEGHEVERVFDTGVAASQSGETTVFPHLRADAEVFDDTGAMLQSDAEVITSNGLDVVEALGRLEAALADCYHGQGVIHVPSALAAEMAAQQLLVRRGDQMTTVTGHRVALGSGYSGAAPDGTSTDGVLWMYATGAVFHYRSGVTVFDRTDSFDRERNTLSALAERRYVIGWDCCHFAVPVVAGGVPSGAFDSALPELLE